MPGSDPDHFGTEPRAGDPTRSIFRPTDAKKPRTSASEYLVRGSFYDVGFSRISFRLTLYRAREDLFPRVSQLILPLFPHTSPRRLLSLEIWSSKQATDVNDEQVLGSSRAQNVDLGPEGLRPVLLAALRSVGLSDDAFASASATVALQRAVSGWSGSQSWRGVCPAPQRNTAGAGGSGRRTKSSSRMYSCTAAAPLEVSRSYLSANGTRKLALRVTPSHQ